MKFTDAVSQPPFSDQQVQHTPQPPPVQNDDFGQTMTHHDAAPFVEVKRAPFPLFRVFAFSLFVSGLSIFFLFVDFQGVSTAEGMEQADVARSLARGEGFTSKTLRPIALATRVNRSGGEEIPAVLGATSQGPLNSLLNGALLWLSGTDYEVDFQYRIFFPDRVIAAGAVLLFLASLGLLFGLVSRLFDGVLAGFTVVAMLLCEMMWRFTQSGLPHMLGLFVFMAALCFLVKALKLWRLGKVPLFPLAGSAFCFGLLVLVSPIGLGVGLAAVFFVGVTFKRKLLLAAVFALVMSMVIAPWMVRNVSLTGSLLGTSSVEIQDSWGESAGSPLMRSYEPGGESAFPRFFLSKKMGRVLEQHFTNFTLLVGGSIGAVLFWLSLLHPFRNPEAVLLRNGLAMMWGGAMLLMMMFGTPDLLMDANQVHLWFVPLATAFGFAILTVFWARLPIAHQRFSAWKWAHLVAAVLLTGLPLIITLPGRATLGFNLSNRVVHWPPYDPAAISFVNQWSKPSQVVFSDVPWAVAWYADRSSVWLPETTKQFEILATQYEKQTPEGVAGLFLTPQTLDQPMVSGVVAGDFEDWNRILLVGPMKSLGVEVFDQMPSGMRYGKRLSASKSQESWFFSPRPIGNKTAD